MGLEKKTVKIIVIVAVVLVIIGGVIGLVLGLLLSQRYVELEVWPRTDDYYNWEQPLIQFRPADMGSWHVWYSRINRFLKEYETTYPEDPPRAPCTTVHRNELKYRSSNCEMVIRKWGPCSVDTLYGYNIGKPCVFLRLTHIHYWVPEPYNISTRLPLPPEMPENLKQVMIQRPAERYGDYVWVSCDGEFSADKENIGPLLYIPGILPPGFPLRQLHTADKIPYANRHLPDQSPPPLIAVYFQNPRRDVLINVECRIWTRDIVYDPSSRVGRARFEIFINN